MPTPLWRVQKENVSRLWETKKIKACRSFKPDNYITRAEAVIMFNSIFNRVPDKDFINKNEVLLVKFKDLKKDHWAYYELEEAANSHEFNKETNNRYETWIKLI